MANISCGVKGRGIESGSPGPIVFGCSEIKEPERKKAAVAGGLFTLVPLYSVDSISNPQACSKGSGMYFEFLLRRAHSRRRVERWYCSGSSLNSFTACSKEVTMGITGPIGSGFPQLGFPRRFAMIGKFLYSMNKCFISLIPKTRAGFKWIHLKPAN